MADADEVVVAGDLADADDVDDAGGVADGPDRRRRLKLGIGVAGLVLTVLFFAAYLLSTDGGARSSDRDPVPSPTIEVTANKLYHLSTIDGPTALVSDSIQCTWTMPNRADNTFLPVTIARGDARVTHVIGTFVGPINGTIKIACPATGAVFVDDADNTAFDYGGLWVVLTSIAALVGVAGLLGGLYSRRPPPNEPVTKAYEAGPEAPSDPDAMVDA